MALEPEYFREKIAAFYVTENNSSAPFSNMLVDEFPATFPVILRSLLFQLNIKKIYEVNIQVYNKDELLVNTKNNFQINIEEISSQYIKDGYATTFIELEIPPINVPSERLIRIVLNLKFGDEILSSSETYIAVVKEHER